MKPSILFHTSLLLSSEIIEDAVASTAPNVSTRSSCVTYTIPTEMPVHDIPGVGVSISVQFQHVLALLDLQLCIDEAMVVGESASCCSLTVPAVAMDCFLVCTCD